MNSQKRILLYDGTESNLLNFSDYLRAAGYFVFEVPNLRAAQLIRLEFPFDLIISDDIDDDGLAWLLKLNVELKQKILHTWAMRDPSVMYPELPSLRRPYSGLQLLTKIRELIGP